MLHPRAIAPESGAAGSGVARGRNRRRVDQSPRGGLRARFSRALARAAAVAGGLVLAALAAAAGWHFLTQGEVLRIRAIRFAGLARASESELSALLPVKPGDNLVRADLEAMERALRRHPWVKSATAHRRLPPAIEVRVEEREPRALVDLGGLYVVDRDAQVFKRAAAGDGLDLPLVTGFTRDDFVQRRADVEALLSGALALLDGYSHEGLAALYSVSEVHVDADEGVTLFLGDEGMQVRLGVGDLPSKLSRLHRVLSALRAQGARAEVLHLDNRQHPSWVTVRLAGRSADAAVKVASKVAGRTGPRGP
jgi:cell division protein FtsQ